MDWAPANMRDYEAEQRSFSWDKARAEIAGLPGGRGLNIAHEIVDRYTQGRASTTEATMRAGDVMSSRVVSIAPRATVREAIALMLDNRISGLPVIDSAGALVGIVTEGDFLRRAETGAERKPVSWLQFFVSLDRLAGDYVRSHGGRVEEVMTPDTITVSEDTPLDEVVRIMERQRIKRVPVVRNEAVVGIISRANLLRALASVNRGLPPPAKSDAEIRQRLGGELARQPWAPIALIDFVVKDGVVEFWGDITGLEQEEALKVCAENIPGVKAVLSHLKLGRADHIAGVDRAPRRTGATRRKCDQTIRGVIPSPADQFRAR